VIAADCNLFFLFLPHPIFLLTSFYLFSSFSFLLSFSCLSFFPNLFSEFLFLHFFLLFKISCSLQAFEVGSKAAANVLVIYLQCTLR